MASTPDQESVERVIPAPAADIFALITDPRRHREFDGSGSVRDARGDTARLVLGRRFGMGMRIGIPYAMVSTVVEYEKDRLLAWQTRAPTPIGRFFAGRIWRYELEPVEGGTLVRETWDLTHESALTRGPARKAAGVTRRNMARTLERIERIVTA